ncbi:MAG TPA: hypothetical protein DEA08_26415 [Planctomycetes bacterium]|nr:hypothetical protein [Planctomycetota bacterium]
MRAPLTLAALLVALSWPLLGQAQEPGATPGPPAQALPVSAGGQRPVTVGLYVIDLTRIDDARREAEVDFVVLVSWQDQTLAGRYGAPTVVPRDSIWNPDVGVFNNRDLRTQRSEDLVVAPDGSVTQIQRYIGTISASFDLSEFPRDRHRLAIELASTRSAEVQLVPAPPLIGQASELSLPGWRASQGEAELFEHQLLQLRLPGFRYSIPVARRFGYYAWNVFLPLSLVVLMAFSSLWIRPSHAAPRIGVAATSMLTVIAYRFALAQHVPQLDYLTRLDAFLLGATALVFLSVVIAVWSTTCEAGGDSERALRIDRRARVGLLSGFLLAALASLLA